MAEKTLCFGTLWRWLIKSTPAHITYNSEVELFEHLFWRYIKDECIVYTAARISQMKAGRPLPRKLVSRYWLDMEYRASLFDAIKTVIINDFDRQEESFDQLIRLIERDLSISDRQKHSLMDSYSDAGGDGSARWLLGVLLYAMRARSDGGKSA